MVRPFCRTRTAKPGAAGSASGEKSWSNGDVCAAARAASSGRSAVRLNISALIIARQLTPWLISTNLFVMKLWVFLLAAAAIAQPAFDVASVKQGGPVRPDGLLDINLGTAQH